MKDLTEIRGQIDEIDRRIVELFEQRMELTDQVAAYKIATGKAVFDPERERQKLDAVAALAHSDFNSRGIREWFSCLMDISKERQYRLLEQSGVRADGRDTKACTGGEN